MFTISNLVLTNDRMCIKQYNLPRRYKNKTYENKKATNCNLYIFQYTPAPPTSPITQHKTRKKPNAAIQAAATIYNCNTHIRTSLPQMQQQTIHPIRILQRHAAIPLQRLQTVIWRNNKHSIARTTQKNHHRTIHPNNGRRTYPPKSF